MLASCRSVVAVGVKALVASVVRFRRVEEVVGALLSIAMPLVTLSDRIANEAVEA